MNTKRAMIRLAALALALVLFAPASGQYRHVLKYETMFGWNGYTGTDRYTIPWLSKHYYGSLAGRLDGTHSVGMAGPDSVYDEAAANGVFFDRGPYASDQEINLYEGLHPEYDSTTRLGNIDHWHSIYSRHYLDSVGIDVETLYVQVADDMVAMTQKGDGYRRILYAGLTWPEHAWTYQYWNNNATDVYRYPGGYVNMVNCYNPDARLAVRYSYRRRFIYDSATFAPNGKMFTSFFMDNQYRDGAALSSYYTIDSTRGGPSTGLDWMQQPNILAPDSTYKWYDKGVVPLDSVLQTGLDSVTTARGLHRIIAWANVNKFYWTHIRPVVGRVGGITLENPIDYGKDAFKWRGWYVIADSMAAHPETKICWTLSGDLICSPTPSAWNYDSTRIYMMHFSFMLSVWNPTTVWAPMRYNDSLRWRNIYERDFGLPVAPADFIDSLGSGYYKDYTIRRLFQRSGDTTIVLLRTSYATSSFITDSVLVNLERNYYAVNANGDTAASAVSSIYLKPYSGWIGVRKTSGGGVPTIGATPASFTFSSSYGGPAPGSQSLTIQNTGTGTLNWTVAKTAAWLTITPGSGVDYGVVTVSVNPAGLAVGTYTDNITISDPAATNHPQTRLVTYQIIGEVFTRHARRINK